MPQIVIVICHDDSNALANTRDMITKVRGRECVFFCLYTLCFCFAGESPVTMIVLFSDNLNCVLNEFMALPCSCFELCLNCV